jgi:ABC-type Fe3+/spermidine/putrescine transport system ATPase subunit
MSPAAGPAPPVRAAAPAAAPPPLELRGLELALGDFRLGPLSLSLAAGEYLVLLGPSGCGKTSLLRAVAGIHPSAPGQLRLGGSDAGRLPPQLRRVGYVSQGADLFPHLSAGGNIAYGLGWQGLPREEVRRRVRRLATMLEIEELLSRAPATLSGGEAKRVALARSLATEPRLLLLDEPLSMLDHNARRRLLELLRRLHAELGTATVHVTHDREEAWALGGRCAVMRAGRIEADGAVGELFRRPASRFTAEFLGGENLFPALFEERAGRPVAVFALGEFELAAAPPLPDGWVLVRPETILTAAGPECPAAFAARVLSVSDRGIYREVRLEAAGGVRLVWHAVAAGGPPPSPGAEVRLRLGEPPHAMMEDRSGG